MALKEEREVEQHIIPVYKIEYGISLFFVTYFVFLDGPNEAISRIQSNYYD